MDLEIENELEFKKTNFILSEVINYSEKIVNQNYESDNFKDDFLMINTLTDALKQKNVNE